MFEYIYSIKSACGDSSDNRSRDYSDGSDASVSSDDSVSWSISSDGSDYSDGSVSSHGFQ